MPVRISREGSRRVAAIILASASLVAGAAVGSVFLGTARDAWTAVAAAGPAGPADGILLIAGLVGTLLSLWLGLGMTLSALSALPGALGQGCRRLSGRVAPAAVRKAVAFVLGTTLTAALIPGTAVAGIGHGALRPGVVAAARPDPSRGPWALAIAAPDASFRLVSGRPAGQDIKAAGKVAAVNDLRGVELRKVRDVTEVRDAAPAPAWLGQNERPGKEVVVLRGDTLWSIAAQHLGPAATAAEIDAEWPRWFAANVDVIGDDASRILPGQLLRPPPALRAGS
jgi:nucleoid-associated protein YgaU